MMNRVYRIKFYYSYISDVEYNLLLIVWLVMLLVSYLR
jgi:hypothetical protein